MSARVRWGFDRKAGAKARPLPLVRPIAYCGSYPISGRPMVEVLAEEARSVSTSLDTNGIQVSHPVPDEGPASLRDPVRAMPPKPVSAPVAVVPRPPLPDHPAPARDPSPKFALGDAPSGMEDAARQWIKPASLICTTALPPVPDENDKVWCRRCDARVPAWFGRDCISATCDLKGRA